MAPNPPIHILPVEILIDIFRLSTQVPNPYRLGDATYWPFRNNMRRREHPLPFEKEIWATKLFLPLVCRIWRELSFGITYEKIHAGEHVGSLLKAFEESENTFPGNGFGRQVRHLVLSFWNSTPIPLPNILRWCPNVTCLTKDDVDISPVPTLDVDLTRIKRFDWVFKRYAGQGLQNTSHGRDFYRDIIARATNLQYLYIAISYPNTRLSRIQPYPLSVHSLTTLHVQHIGNNLRDELEGWQFPNLKNLITDSSLTRGTFSSLFGPQIEVIEFLADEALHNDACLDVLNKCPNVRDLNYYIQFASFSHLPFRHEKLECVRLHSGANYMLDDEWAAVTQQLDIFAGKSFPALKRISLRGDWDKFIKEPAFDVLRDAIRCRAVFSKIDSAFWISVDSIQS